MLIGRESERRSIELLLAGARVGESGVLVLVGDAGIGKTALLDWAAANVNGMQVFRAVGIEAEQEIPFSGLLQLLRPMLDEIELLPSPQAEAMARALALRPGAVGERFAVGAGTLGLICRAAERCPVALLIDDAHLLDGPSAQALAFAARRLLADPVVLLATVRLGEPCALTEAGLPEVVIGGLDLAASSELLATVGSAALPAEAVDRIHRAAGGNPLAVLELSDEADRLLRLPPDAPVPVPAVVARAVARETGRLDAPARAALLVVAASGGERALVLRAMAALGVDVDALDRAERANLITERSGQLTFRHPLVRSSVYSAADPDDRRRVHQMIFGALPEHDLDHRAWHLAEAASGLDPQAADLLDLVGARARMRSADAVAATAFERAARLTPDGAAAVGRLLSAGESAWLAGQPGRARALLTEALEMATAPAARVRAQEVLGAIATRSGSLIDARRQLASASEEAAEFDVDLAVVLLADAVNACFYLGDSAWAMNVVGRLEALLAVAETARARILGLMAVGTAQVLGGGGGIDPIRRSVELLGATDELNDDPRRFPLRVLGPLLLRESGTGRQLVRGAVEESRRRAAIGVLPTLLFNLARDEATTDSWPAAAAEYHEAIRLARETGQITDLAASLAGLGWLEARMGLRSECVTHLTESAGLCDGHQIHLFRAWSHYGMGDLEFGAGSVTTALGHYEALTAFLERSGIHDVDLAADPERVEALVRLGRRDEARRIARSYLYRARAKGQPWAMARAERAVAICEPAESFDERFGAALGWHAKALDDFERGRTLLAHGSRLRRSHRRAAARPVLRSALEVFDRLGAAPYANLAAVELRATGERPHARGASLTAELTPQELQIATMLADGRTTRETASALFLSPKTVEYHLRHVYTKLDVHTRDDLAHRLAHEPE